ncbi:MAG: DNA polymerase III subunit delta [Lachnospiraceae bacterium]|nr:DNA polymerase III subunit delta [Lachnospiraceae bacterium]
MKRIAADIKNGSFCGVYLLYGEETYLVKQYRDNLKRAIAPEDDAMNCSVYSGKDIDVNELADMAETMPFFADRRVIIVENSGFFKGAANERLVELIKNLPETSHLIFSEAEVDKRGKLYKAVTANGYAALCEAQDEATLKRWVMSLLKKEDKRITADALNILLDKTGTSMENIRREVEKLVCYKYYDEGFTAQDVEEICTVQLQNRIFDMVEAVAAKDRRTALSLYYDLIALKEAPMKILALIARQFNMLLQVKEMRQKGYPESAIAQQTGLNAYYLKKKYIPQAARFELPQLENALKACVEADENVKTGKMPDNLSVELIIIGLSAG